MYLKPGRLGPSIVLKSLTTIDITRRSLQITKVLSARRDRSVNLKVDSFANGSNASYIERLYRKWSKDPNSVDEVKLLSICCCGALNFDPIFSDVELAQLFHGQTTYD